MCVKMTGKKIQNATGKGRNSYQNAGNHQIVSTSKNPIKQTTSTAVTATINSPMANHSNFNSIPPAPVTSTIVPIAQPNMSTLIKSSENFKYLPRYTTALTKPATELFPAEELDGIQLELEVLLSTVALRYRSLKSGFDSLDREDKNYKKNDKLTSTGKRKRDDANKKSTKEAKTAASQPAKIAKVKASGSSDSPAHSQHTDDSMDGTIPPLSNSQSSSTGQTNPKVLVPKNDIPNKFWLSVEPYCMPITQEDVKLLDDMIEEYSGPLVPPIPELGPHYASRWATEDLREEQDNSNQNAKANKRFTNAANPEVNSMLKKGEKVANDKMMAEGKIMIEILKKKKMISISIEYSLFIYS